MKTNDDDEKAKLKVPPALIPVFKGKARYRGAYGGRGSGKTRTFALMTAVQGYKHGITGGSGQILCGREFMNSLDDSSLEEVKRAIEVLQNELQKQQERVDLHLTAVPEGTFLFLPALSSLLGIDIDNLGAAVARGPGVIATDVPAYFQQVLDVFQLQEHEAFHRCFAQTSQDGELERPARSEYEQVFLKAGKVLHYAAYQKIAG